MCTYIVHTSYILYSNNGAHIINFHRSFIVVYSFFIFRIIAKRTFVLAVSFQNGFIYLLKSYDDVTPIQINTEMNGALGLTMEWSNSKELLAVAGTRHQPPSSLDSQATPVFLNLLKFYTESGVLLYSTRIPNVTNAVSAMTWGHNDKRLFIATGTQVHIAWVSRKVASLQLLCRLQIQACIGSELLLPKLPLPSRIKTLIGSLFAQTIRVCTNNLLFHGYSLLIPATLIYYYFWFIEVINNQSIIRLMHGFLYFPLVLCAKHQIAARVRITPACVFNALALHHDSTR